MKEERDTGRGGGGGGKVENLNAGQRLGNDDSQTQERERGGG